jgi:hypothetical protein
MIHYKRLREYPSFVIWRPSAARRNPMTLVIGALADSRHATDLTQPDTSVIVLCADAMASYQVAAPMVYSGLSTVATSVVQSKIYSLPHEFFCGFSDSFHWSHNVATELHNRMVSIDPDDPGFRDIVKSAVREAFGYAFTWFRAEYLVNEEGITAEEYLGAPGTQLDAAIRAEAKSGLLEAYKYFPAELIICGQTKRGPLLLKANGRGMQEITSFAITGAPEESAINWLRHREQDSFMSVPRTALHILEAKRFCELDPHSGVSRHEQFVIMKPASKAEPIHYRGDLLEKWRNDYGTRSTQSIDRPENRTSFETAFGISLDPMPSGVQKSAGRQ